jgi:nitrogen fixation protein FixH
MRMSGARQSRNIWRFFPWFVAAGMTTVIVVNIGMVYAALHTFPGDTAGGGYDVSNHYDAVLDRVARQDAMGWTARVELEDAARPVVVLTDRSGNALSGAGIAATAERPVGDPHRTDVRFSEVSPGRYVGATALDEKGQWDLQISATAAGRQYSTTRRLVAR